MSRIPERFNVGDRENITLESLLDLLEKIYMQLAESINQKPSVYFRNTDGQTTDTFLANGDINVNETTDKIEMLVEHVDSTTVVWKEI